MLAYIGSRTTVCRVEGDGRLTPIQVLGDLVNPSFLALNRRGDRLYSVHGDGDACSVFVVASHDGTLTHLQTQGCGAHNPVHLALDAEDARLYSVNELDATVTACAFDAATGTLYASHRGADRVEVFAIDADTGRLTHLQSRSSEGRTPRFFALHPQGGFLCVFNEDSDTVVTLSIDPIDGQLGETVATLRCGSPVCLVFTRPAAPARP